jgi:hypothetical protein
MLRALGSQLLRRSTAGPAARVFTSSAPRLAEGGDETGEASTQKRIEVGEDITSSIIFDK